MIHSIKAPLTKYLDENVIDNFNFSRWFTYLKLEDLVMFYGTLLRGLLNVGLTVLAVNPETDARFT